MDLDSDMFLNNGSGFGSYFDSESVLLVPDPVPIRKSGSEST